MTIEPNIPFRLQIVLNVITYAIGLIVFVCIYPHVDIVYSALFSVLLCGSAYFEYRQNYFIPRWLLIVLSLVVVLFALYRLDLNDLVVQMLEALLLLLAIKFLEQKKFRDYMQIYAISLFLLSGLGLLSLSIVFLVYFLLLISLLTVAIVLLTFLDQAPDYMVSRQSVFKIVSRTLLIPLLAIPLSVLMFVILPRPQYPLLDFLNRSDRAKTGFTDNVRLGTVANIQEDSSLIMRVHVDKRLNEDDLYWRGITFDYFDGRGWRHDPGQAGNREPARGKRALSTGKSVRQTIYLEPYGNTYIFALDKPVYISLRDQRRRGDFTFSLGKPVENRLRYEAVSATSLEIFEDGIDRTKYLQVPSDISPQVFGLVRDLSRGLKEEQVIQTVYRFFHSGRYSYSMRNLPVSGNPLEEFLFKQKSGNCEYFASAFAVMLRLAGVPSRLVGGYRGGYFNEVGQYYMIPQKNAHVWVEAYTEQGAWVRLDPTPGGPDAYFAAGTGGFFFRIRLLMDTINYYWNAMIINYNFEKQMRFIQGFRSGFSKPSLASFRAKVGKWTRHALIPAGLVLAIAGILVFFLRRPEPSEGLLRLFLKRMERRGFTKKHSEGLEEFVAKVDDAPTKSNAELFVSEYEKIYFTDGQFSAKDIKRLRALARAI